MENLRLFRLAHEGIAVNAYFVPGEGWHVIVRMRRGDESWESGYDERFSRLATPEMADTICAALHTELGLI